MSPGTAYRVLVFDDDEALGEMLREYLSISCNCTVDVVSAEQDFWPRLSSTRYDILFLDYQLRETTGLAILSQMKNRDDMPPTVMMTGQGNEKVAAQAIQDGAIDYLTKGEYALTELPGLVERAVRLRRVQETMRSSSEKIRYQSMLLDNLRDAVVVWGADGIITYWNEAAADLYNLRAGQMVGKPVDTHFFPLFSTPVLWKGLPPDENLQTERQFETPHRGALWISSVISPLVDREGQVSGYMDVSRDITAAKLIEQVLQTRLEGERLLASLSSDFIQTPETVAHPKFNHALEAISTFIQADQGLLFLNENDFLESRAYFPALELSFDRPLHILPLEEFSWLRPLLLHRQIAILPTGNIPGLAATLGHKKSQGSLVLLPMTAQGQNFGLLLFHLPTHLPGWENNYGNVLITFSRILMGTLLQIRSNQKLKASEERYRAIVEDYQTEMICHFQDDGVLTFVNEACCRYFQTNRWQLIGRNFLEKILEEDRPAVRALIASLTKEQPAARSIHRAVNPQGEVCWHEWSIRRIDDASNGLIEYQAVGRDITDRKKMEAEVQMAHQQVAEAARLASVGRLAASVAHQISNPLTTIIAEGQILRQSLDKKDPAYESAEAIEQAGWRAQQVIDVLLKFSEASKEEWENLPIQDTIRQAALLASAQVLADHLKLEMSLPEKPLFVRGNRQQLIDLWLNFLLGIPSLYQKDQEKTLYLEVFDPVHHTIPVKINIHGLRLSEDERIALFEPKMIPTSLPSGTGMELTICREILRRHNGQVLVNGTDHATVIEILLPEGE